MRRMGARDIRKLLQRRLGPGEYCFLRDLVKEVLPYFKSERQAKFQCWAAVKRSRGDFILIEHFGESVIFNLKKSLTKHRDSHYNQKRG